MSQVMMPAPSADLLTFTGERMVPGQCALSVFWEHIYRYRFALPWVQGQRVLDVACGEGYGCAAMQRGGAASVVGVDICPRTCDHARRNYGIDVHCAPATELPFADATLDVVLSFETIEHVDEPASFVGECRRVLRPGGRLIISTPNTEVYLGGEHSNPYHVSEMTIPAFLDLFNDRFRRKGLYGQSLRWARALHPAALAAPDSWWIDRRGGYRVQQLLRRLLCPRLHAADPSVVNDPVEAVLQRESPLAWRVHPHGISPLRDLTAAQPTYILGVFTAC